MRTVRIINNNSHFYLEYGQVRESDLEAARADFSVTIEVFFSLTSVGVSFSRPEFEILEEEA